MNVYWLEQVEADVPRGYNWLSAGESVRFESMRFPKRRNDWRLGRWTAKCAVACYLKVNREACHLAGIEVRAAESGAPEVFVRNEPAPVTISISHRDGAAVCAVAPSGVLLGCDLEVVELRSGGFIADFFTEEEQSLVSRTPDSDRSQLVALLWSAKESALKALGEGLRLDTRCLTVCPVDGPPHPGQCDKVRGDPMLAGVELNGSKSWRPLCVSQTDGQVFDGWWRQTGDLLRTMVAVPLPAPPITLVPAEYFPN